MAGQNLFATSLATSPWNPYYPGSRIHTTNEEVDIQTATISDNDYLRISETNVDPKVSNPVTRDVVFDHRLLPTLEVDTLNCDSDSWNTALDLFGVSLAGIGPKSPYRATEVVTFDYQWLPKTEFGAWIKESYFWKTTVAKFVAAHGGASINQKPERPNLKAQIRRLLEVAGSDNWNGEGALAISDEAVRVALALADKLPAGVDDPDVSATAHGEVDFDWMAGRDAMLTISIDSHGTLAWAALFDEFRSRGTARWKNELVCPVDCCLRHLGACAAA